MKEFNFYLMKEIKDGINREIFHVPEQEESIM